MNRRRWMVAAVAVLGFLAGDLKVAPTRQAQAGVKLEALPSEAKSLGVASRVHVVWVGEPAEPFSGSLAGAYGKECNERGYKAAEPHGIITDMDPS